MLISELIKKLQEIQKEHGDVETLAVFDTCGEGEWVSLEAILYTQTIMQ